jgi:hypothetical protein
MRNRGHFNINRFILPAVLILIVLTSAGEGAGKVNIKLDNKKLEAGELQVFQQEFAITGGGRKKRVIGVMLYNAPPDRLWSVLKDWSATPKFVPAIKYYKTKHIVKPLAKGGKGESIIEGSMKVAFLDIVYTLDVKFDDPGRMHSWRMLKDAEIAAYRAGGIALADNSSTLNAVEGFGYVESYDEGRKSVYYYAPVVEVSVPVPAYVERSLVKSSLNDYMNGLKRMVEGK